MESNAAEIAIDLTQTTTLHLNTTGNAIVGETRIVIFRIFKHAIRVIHPVLMTSTTSSLLVLIGTI